MSDLWRDMKKEVEMKLRKERAEEAVSCSPQTSLGLRSCFPIKQRIKESMDVKFVKLPLKMRKSLFCTRKEQTAQENCTSVSIVERNLKASII